VDFEYNMKEFNITGTCNPEKHYMVDITSKLKKVIALVEKGEYLHISRPRQYGKTTFLSFLKKEISSNYLVLSLSFEGLGDEAFQNLQSFCNSFIQVLLEIFKNDNKQGLYEFVEEYQELKNLKELGIFVSNLVRASNQKVILIIDEVDKASNYNLFINFLGMLRDKFLKRNSGIDDTFHSVILAGLHDIKNIKLKIRPDSDSKYNSPWNIASEFKVDMSFSPDEIATMLVDYERTNAPFFHTPSNRGNEETGKLNIPLISKEIYKFTSGYPFLVSKICKVIEEDLGRDWSVEGIQNSVNLILKEENTLFDDLIKNLEQYNELYNLVYAILIEGKKIPFEIYNPTINLGSIYGIFSRHSEPITISNKIFEKCIYNYMISKKMISEINLISESSQFIHEGRLDMENVLIKFQEIMQDEYRDKDNKFIEREGRLLFLCFLKPIINGKGYYYIEPETREDTRMDVVVNFGNAEYIIELKIWRGKKNETMGIEQLEEYLQSRRQSKGYLVVFNFNKSKEYSAEWIDMKEKKVFKVMV
jgi:hypothetical protein